MLRIKLLISSLNNEKILFLILFLFYSCGYEPIYINKNNTNFKFQQISFEGDENLNNKLSSKLFFENNC